MSPKLKFSSQPGAYERHLQRKANNPLFSLADSHLLQAEIDQARRRDQQDLQAFSEAFQETIKQAAALAGSVDSEVVLNLKADLERLYVTSCSLAGDLQAHRQALLKLIALCMQSVRAGAGDDLHALNKLRDEEQARQLYFELLRTPLVADLIRDDDIISANELIPSLLSEEPVTLVRVIQLFDSEQLQTLIEQTRDFVTALDEGVRLISAAEQKLQVMQEYLAGLQST